MMRKLNVLLIATVIVLATTSANAAMTAPFNVVATPRSTSTIDLTWTDSNLNVTAFEVERSLDPERSFSVVATVIGGARTFHDGGLAAATMYYYRVRAVAAGRASRRSNVASARTFSTTILPSATTTPVRTATPIPTLTATRTAAPTLTQTPVATSTSTRTATPTATPTRTPTVTATTTVTATITVTRTATAVPTSTVTITATPIRTATPVASATPTVTATPDTVPPAPPTSLSAAPRNCTQLDLTWVASSDGGSGLKGYNIYRSGVFLKQVLAPSTTTSDSGLSGGSAYSYTARAVDYADNVSGPSNTAAANTPACNQPPVANAGADQTAAVGTPVALVGSASSDSDGTITSYAWTFGDGASGSGAVVNHDYAVAGSYTATLTVTDNSGAQASDTALVTVTTTAAGGQVVWRQARGGASSTLPSATATDGAGNIVVVGTFYGTTDLGIGALTSAGVGDIFLAKYSSAGTPLWSRRFGGTANDRGYGVAVDRRPNCDGAGGTDCIVLTGTIEGTADLGRGPLVSAGQGDIVVARYSAAGTPLWTQRYGDAQNDFGYAAAVDRSGNVLVTGFFTASTDFGAGRLYSQYQDADTFVLKLAPSGALIWARNFWSASLDVGTAIAVDTAGDIAVAGYHMGSIDVGTGARLSRGREDVFVAKLAGTDGHALWFKGFGASMSDLAYGVAVDAAGDVAIVGTSQMAADVGGGTITAAGTDVFVTKLSAAAGAPLWSRRCTGTYTDTRRGAALTIDAANNLLIAGFFAGTLDCGGGPVTGAATGYSDAFAAKLTSAGVPLWTKAFGASGADTATAIAADSASGEVVLSGAFQYTVDFGGATLRSTGADTLFLLKLTP